MPTLYQHDSCRCWEEFQVSCQKSKERWLVGGSQGSHFYLCTQYQVLGLPESVRQAGKSVSRSWRWTETEAVKSASEKSIRRW